MHRINLLRRDERQDGRIDLYVRRPCPCFACLSDAWIISRLPDGSLRRPWKYARRPLAGK